jgi:MipA family protein
VAIRHLSFSVAIGAGLRSNPLAHSDAIPLVALPEISYYGKRLFLHNLDVGATLWAGKAGTLDLVATPSYDRAYFYRTDLQNFLVAGSIAPGPLSGVPCQCTLVSAGTVPDPLVALYVRPKSPRVVYLSGADWSTGIGRLQAQLMLLHDMTGTTNGSEVRAAIALPVSMGASHLSLHGGFTWKSQQLVDYYYGVPGLYRPGSALNPFAKLSWRRRLDENWTFEAFADAQRLATSITHSPLISRREVTTFFIGMIYEP